MSDQQVVVDDFEHVLVLVKPRFLEYSEIIISMIGNCGLTAMSMKKQTYAKGVFERHCKHLRDEPFFTEVVDYLSSGPVEVIIAFGPDAIKKVQTLAGATNPKEAADGTIRRKFGSSIIENAIDVSETRRSSDKDIKRFLGLKFKL